MNLAHSWWVANPKISNDVLGLSVVCFVLACISALSIWGWLHSYPPLATEFVPAVEAVAGITTILSLIVALTAYWLGSRAKSLAVDEQREAWAQMVGVSGTTKRLAPVMPNGEGPARCRTGAEAPLQGEPSCDHKTHDVKVKACIQNNSPYPVHDVELLVPGADVWARPEGPQLGLPKRLGTVLAGNSIFGKFTVYRLKENPEDGATADLVVEFKDVWGGKWRSTSDGVERI